MKLDLNKPLFTRDGRPVRILCTDLKYTGEDGRERPIVVAVTLPNGKEEFGSRLADGRTAFGIDYPFDIVQPKIKKWLWVYSFVDQRNWRNSDISHGHYATAAEAAIQTYAQYMKEHKVIGRILESEIEE